MKFHALALSLLLCVAAFAEDSTPLPFEPWVKTARSGDFIVRKYTDGTTQRCEVKSIDASYVVVEEKSELKGKETIVERKYKRDESSAKTREIEMKSSGKDKQTINGTKIRTESFDGFIVLSSREWNGELVAMKLAKYHKVVGEGVPFGGAIRVLQAPDDKIEVKGKEGGGFVRQMNTDETLRVVYEAVNWGNKQDSKDKPGK
jgi:hypothetical protein